MGVFFELELFDEVESARREDACIIFLFICLLFGMKISRHCSSELIKLSFFEFIFSSFFAIDLFVLSYGSIFVGVGIE